MMNAMNLYRYHLPLIVATLLAGCTIDGRLTGAGSETTNGFTAVARTEEGSAVSHALVRLRPEGYLSDTGSVAIAYDRASVIDTFTDANGRFTITAVNAGKYSIEIQDGMGNGALLHGNALKDRITDCGAVTVTPAGGIRGYINGASATESVAVYIRVYGMERSVRSDPKSGAFALHGMPQGEHTMYFQASSPSYKPKDLPATVSPDSVCEMGKVSLFPYAGWTYSKAVRLNTTSSGAGIAGNVYAFPVLVRLNSGNFTFSQAQKYGEDIRFTKSDSTPLAFEIERWDLVGGGRAEIWVNADTIFGNNDRQCILMFWGNALATPLSQNNAVFTTANGFQGVWHLSDASGDSIRDASANRYNGISPDSARPSIAEGVVGTCRAFDGAQDFITMPNTASGRLNFPQNGSYSVSAWVMADTFIDFQTVISKGKFQYFLWMDSTMWQFWEFHDRAGWEASAQQATLKQWVLLTGVRDGAAQYLYVNGEPTDSVSLKSDPNPRSSASNLILGRAHEMSSNGTTKPTFCYFKGKIDEVRILSMAQGKDWARLSYMNQRADDRLVVYGK
jgi:hypothetical protein